MSGTTERHGPPRPPAPTLGDLTGAALNALQAAGLPFETLPLDEGFKRHPHSDLAHLWVIANTGTGRTGRPFLQVSAGDPKDAGGVDTATFTWCSWKDHEGARLDPAELADAQRAIEAQRRDAQARKVREQAQARANAATDWQATTADGAESHPYLLRKQVGVYGVKVSGDSLLIPVRDTAGRLHGLQRIGADGDKRFTPGTAVTGHFHLIGEPTAGGRLYLCEGYAKTAAVHEATAAPAVCAFNCGNLPAVAKVLKATYPGVALTIAGDDDTHRKGNPGRTHAEAAARLVGAPVVFPVFRDGSSPDGRDWDDLARLEGAEAVKAQLAAPADKSEPSDPPPREDGDPGATPGPDDHDTEPGPNGSDFAATVKRLAALHPIEYDRVRDDEAKTLGIRVGTLDREVSKARGRATNGPDEMSVVENLEPWDDPVSGLALAEAVRADFMRYVIADQEALDTLTVWTLGTYVYDVFQVWAKAFLSSPERRCGKSTTLTVIEANVSRALMASSISASALFRAVDLWRPSLILDEADRLPKDNEELTAVINAGHMRRTAVIIRNVPVGDSYEPRKFSVWAPMVLAAIGRLADTIMDRSIVIPMRRKLPHETSAKVPTDLFEQRRDHRQQCLRWALDSSSALVDARVTLPAHGNDRALDNWTPLFAIAKTLGGDWPGRIGRAFAKLAVADGDHDDMAGPMLLQDVRAVFEDKRVDKIWSADMVAALVNMEDRPWCEWKRGKPMTQNSLARLLAPYKIRPTDLRIGTGKSKGYHLTDFRDAFNRYLTDPPSAPPKQTETPRHPSNGAGSSDFQTETPKTDVSDEKVREASNGAGCPGVSDENQGLGAERVKAPETDHAEVAL